MLSSIFSGADRMFHLIRIVGILLCLTVIVYGVLLLVKGPDVGFAPALFGVGAAADGNIALPVEEVEAALKEARERIDKVHKRGVTFATVSAIVGWLSFALTSAITLIVGFHGQMPPGRPLEESPGLPQKATRLVAILAALAAVLTATEARTEASGNNAIKRASTLAEHAKQIRSRIEEPDTDAEDERDLLSELKRGPFSGG